MNNQQNKEVQTLSSTKPKQTFRNTNASDFITNGEAYQLFPDGILVSKTKLVRNIKKENVQKVLYATGLNTLALNPNFTEDIIFNSLCSINRNPQQVNIPLKYSELKKITANIFKKKTEEGELVPDENHLRKIIVDDVKFPMTPKEKRIIINKGSGIMKSNKTKQTIYNAIEAWNKPEKITINKIQLEVGMCERTVKKYWSEFKELVKSINNDIKANGTVNTDAIPKAIKTSATKETLQPELPNALFDTPQAFHDLVRKYDTSITSESIRRYFNDMSEMGFERNEKNIKSILMVA